jgi:hypothetical protein
VQASWRYKAHMSPFNQPSFNQQTIEVETFQQLSSQHMSKTWV